MKILLFADLHMCSRSSIISKWGDKYPVRLENCIKSVNWLERLAEQQNCSYIVNLGDFFDRPDLNSETITAYNDIDWSSIMHYSLVGNHDASTSSLLFNSVNSLQDDQHKIISEPTTLALNDCYICFLPYVVECDRQPLDIYFPEIKNTDKPVIILSHNDINGIQLGPVVSKVGFTVEEIEQNCQLFLNGHLHNGQAITPKIINVGNLTGKDFGENAFKYAHNVVILDTETFELTYLENPYAYNFYKIQIDSELDLKILDNLKSNAVVSIKCDSQLVDTVKQKIQASEKITDSRLIITRPLETTQENSELDLTVDHLSRFIDCCKNTIGDSIILEEELQAVCN